MQPNARMYKKCEQAPTTALYNILLSQPRSRGCATITARATVADDEVHIEGNHSDSLRHTLNGQRHRLVITRFASSYIKLH